MKSLLPLLLLIGSAHLRRLTKEENSELQATCGRTHSTRFQHNLVNGVRARVDEFPFAASVNVSGILSATVISARHVILFNVAEFDTQGRLSLFGDIFAEGNLTCDASTSSMLLPEELNDKFIINFINKQEEPFEVERVLILSGCGPYINAYHPMIVELKKDLQFDRDHQPICISKDFDGWRNTEVITVFGLGPDGKTLSSADFKGKKCARSAFTPHDVLPPYVGCAKPLNESQGLCAGDFGGGAVADINGRKTLMGIYAEGNDKCDLDPKKHEEPEFIEIAFFNKQICWATGICFDLYEHETTTEDPEVLIRFTEEPEVESITAETFEPLKINKSCNSEEKVYSTHIKNIHIHLHLNENDNLEQIEFTDESKGVEETTEGTDTDYYPDASFPDDE